MLSNIIDRIKLHFRKDKELYSALYEILGVYPRNITYYKVALMHKSLGHRATAEELRVLEGRKPGKDAKDKKGAHKGKDNKAEGRRGDRRQGKGRQGKGQLGKQLNNERLEFLGDAILDAVVGDVVYQRFPGKNEGFLTNTRSKLVQRETLGRLAKDMGISKLILSSGRSATHNSYMGGNAFEALVGALYLDRGYDACMEFWTKRIMGHYLDVDKVANKEVNFKSKILEWSQKNRVTLDFSLEDQTIDKFGSPKFVYSVLLEGVECGRAEGFSKKESQQKACEVALKRLRSDQQFLDSIFAAKTGRTQMEEMPVTVAPDTEATEEEIFIKQPADMLEVEEREDEMRKLVPSEAERELDNLRFDDIQTTPHEKTRDEIIAEAEEAAYEE